MKMNKAGLDLIKKFEGFRAQAYRDAVGVWTIGYGHTSMAGAPRVSPGLIVSRARAEEILAKDVEKFVRKIRPLIKRPLDDNQFSALVSFAYNVGVGGFKRSSVLKMVNQGRFDAVPHRLSLWVKAGGRPLKGLVRRRAAEGELFLSGVAAPETPAGSVEPVTGKPALKSTTNFAAILSAIAGLVSSLTASLSDHATGYLVLVFAAVIIATSVWIIRERWKMTRQDGV